MRGVILFSFVSLGMLTACNPNSDSVLTTGDVTPPGDVKSQGQLYFVKNIMPFMEGTCSDCHSNPDDKFGAPDFLDVSPNSYYASLVSRKDFVGCDIDNSLLLVKGRDPDHPGGGLTDPQHDRVVEWLQIEAEDRFGGKCTGTVTPTDSGEEDTGEEPARPLTGLEAIKQFGACMTLEDWRNMGMHRIAEQTALFNQEQTPCYSCHALGASSNWMPNPDYDAEVTTAFEKMRVPYAILKLATWTVNDEDASFKDIVPAYRWRDKGKEAIHPEYTLEPQYLESLNQWFSITYEKWEKGNCSLTP